MNDVVEELIRDAQQRRAADAVDPERIRRALPARAARRTRQLRLGGALAVVALIATVAVPLTVLSGRTSGTDRVAAPGTQVPSWVNAGFALSYRPTWLPEGVAERNRPLLHTTDSPWRVERYYGTRPDPAGASTKRDDGAKQFIFSLRDTATPEAIPGNGRTPVDIEGRPGFRHDGNHQIEWRLDDRTVATLNPLGVSDEDALRIARSVRPDPTIVRLPGLESLWRAVPRWMSFQNVQMMGDTPEESALMIGVTADPERREYPGGANVPPGGTPAAAPEGGRQEWTTLRVRVDFGETMPTSGEARTVAGRPARVLVVPQAREGEQSPMEPGTHVIVDLGAGALLRVSVNRTAPDELQVPDLVRIAEASVGLTPDMSWIGTR